MKLTSENASQHAEMLLRVAMGIFMLMMGIGKFMNGYTNFVTSFTENFQGSFLPEFLVMPFFYILPFVEVALGVALIVGFYRTWTLFGTGVLYVLFIFGLLSNGDMASMPNLFLYLFITAYTLTLPSCCCMCVTKNK